MPPEPGGGSVFEALFSAYPDALIVVDAAGSIALANRAAASLFGYPVDELIGRPVEMLVPDSIRPRHASYRESYSHSPQTRPMSSQMDLVARRRDGSEVMVEVALSPLQDHGLPLVVASVRAVATYPRGKQMLSRAHYAERVAEIGRHAVNARDLTTLVADFPRLAAQALLADAVVLFLLEPNGTELRRVGSHGPGALEPVGECAVPTPGSAMAHVLETSEAVAVNDILRESRFRIPDSLVETGVRSALLVPIVNRDKTIGLLELRSRRAHHFGPDEIQALHAIVSLLATTLQRIEGETALRHAQRLESLGQLTGGIAHDFNNLLSVILGHARTLEELPPQADEAQRRHLAATITRVTQRGAELTNKLLSFARQQSLQPGPVEVMPLLDTLSDMLRRTLDRRIAIEVDVTPGCAPVLADSVQLESALLNLAINARDAMPEGGTLRFHATACDALPSAADAGHTDAHMSAAGYVAITISDTGSGMPDEVKRRAFEPFFTTKPAGRGTGMGLSSVYGFVRQSSGAITLESALGQGTIFTLYLPVVSAVAARLADGSAASPAVPPGLRVLLVEDVPDVLLVARAFLNRLGCRVTAAASGEEALLALESEPFDLLMTDVSLGTGMSGIQLATQAQASRPDLIVLMMSGDPGQLFGWGRSLPPSWGLLTKPFTREQVARAIVRTLGAR